jgi:hypothetical protein
LQAIGANAEQLMHVAGQLKSVFFGSIDLGLFNYLRADEFDDTVTTRADEMVMVVSLAHHVLVEFAPRREFSLSSNSGVDHQVERSVHCCKSDTGVSTLHL